MDHDFIILPVTVKTSEYMWEIALLTRKELNYISLSPKNNMLDKTKNLWTNEIIYFPENN